MKHAYFGDLSSDSDELFWERTMEFAGRSVHVDMSSDEEVSGKALDAAAAFPRELARFDSMARSAIAEDHGDDSAVHVYLGHHLSNLPGATLEAIFGTSSASAITRDRFLAAMVLHAVSLHPEDPDAMAWFDYTIGSDVTDYLVTVRFDASGAITAVDLES